MIGAEELANISSYQTLSADKTEKVINQAWISLKKVAHMRTILLGAMAPLAGGASDLHMEKYKLY